MNEFVAEDYFESIRRVALGIEPIDALREQPLLTPVMMSFDDVPLGNARPQIQRHPSNRHLVLYDNYFSETPRDADIRIFDQRERLYTVAGDGRRFLPRRLRIPLPTLAVAETLEPSARLCRPHLYPGSAYPLNNVATGVRMHVMRNATATLPMRPARWARIVATVPATETVFDDATVVARAWGDDRGEFLLLLRYHTAVIGIDPEINVRLWVFAPNEVAPPSPQLPAIDPLWDLPLEQPASLADNDPVLRGEEIPAGYNEVAQREVALPLGRLLRGQAHLMI